MLHHEGKPVHRVVSLTYALIPGLSDEDDGYLDVDASVVLDPPADPDEWGFPLRMGGEREARAGGAETAGAFGPFVLPEETKRLTVTLARVILVRPGAPSSAPGDSDRTLEVDLASGTAHWVD